MTGFPPTSGVVVVETLTAGGEWMGIGQIRPGDPLGSMSTTEPGEGRQILSFGWDGIVPGVWRSRGGADVEVGAARLLFTSGLDRIADLRDGPYECDKHLSNGAMLRCRFRLAQ